MTAVKYSRVFLNAFITTLFVTGSAFAGPQADSNEVQISGGFFHSQGEDDASANVDLSYGRFIAAPQHELGMRLGYQGAFVDDGRDVWTASAVPFYDFNFTDGSSDATIVPFIGGFVGGVWNDDDADGVYGPEAGLKFYVENGTFVNIRYRYDSYFDDLEVADKKTDGSHVLAFGLGYNW